MLVPLGLVIVFMFVVVSKVGLRAGDLLNCRSWTRWSLCLCMVPVVAVFELPAVDEAVFVPAVEILAVCVPLVPLVAEPDFEATRPLCFEAPLVDVLPPPNFDVPDLRAI